MFKGLPCRTYQTLAQGKTPQIARPDFCDFGDIFANEGANFRLMLRLKW